ncbi:hypothetical protein P3X46_019434 [Hevea brasiliensis]|uniref:Elongation factor Ts, mitochondrial n=1 Tax=Hevea brasiliensis TaxID=3981 RepID=A0ABQ9LMI7_HEVBR|nr:polyprotein of EF-Ts, chloroplastic [Hevea brasiliensis]XP_057985653.1 polyprotein of EF-Ts, chloroplastic [Hevea brasiliensis]KAJ9167843.1 hypothetical protein P3X46_019434 [Hevea brasiliensis]
MTTIVPSSTSTVSLIHGTAFTIKKNNRLTKCSLSRKSSKLTLSSQRLVFPLLTSAGLFPQYRRNCASLHRSIVHTVSATGTDTDVVVEEPDSPVADEDSDGASEIPADAVESSEKSSIRSDANPALAQSRRSRPSRKSEMPPVKNEDLIPGATFTGKVRSIQPFGAFVDFGAFTDGLVHVSRLSDSFVKDVGSVVSLGQEVTVRLVEVNTETGRISLTMRESDSTSKSLQQRDSPGTASSDKPRPARRNTPKPSQRKEVKTSKFVKGQELDGTVKNLTRSGAFISLPEGEEGFLPGSEESEDGFLNIMGGSSLQVGQEVSVRVLRVARGQVTLTMKKEEENKFDQELIQGVVHNATNPFVLAFRKNKDIAAFLDEREKMEKVAKKPVKPKTSVEVGLVNQTEAVSDMPEVPGQLSSSNEGSVGVSSMVVETVEEVDTTPREVTTGSSSAGDDEEPESIESRVSQSVEGVVETVEEAEAATKEVAMGSSSTGNDEQPESIESSISQTVEGVTETVEEAEATPKEVAVGSSSAGDDKEPESIESSALQSVEGVVETVEEAGAAPKEVAMGSSSTGNDEQLESIESSISQSVEGVIETVEEAEATPKEVAVGSSSAGDYEKPESIGSSSSQSIDGALQTIEKEAEERSGILNSEGSASALDKIIDEASSTDGVEDGKSGLSGEKVDQPGDAIANDGVQIQTPSVENEISSTSPVGDEGMGETSPDENGSITDSGAQADILSPLEAKESQDIEAVVEDQVENTKDEVEVQTSVAEAEIPSTVQIENEKVETVPEKTGTFGDSNGQSSSPSPEESVAKATISPALVKQLREETGAGMMDCKKALSETGGDIIKAQELLRKKGLASAEKKASRATAEGRIGSYIHDSRIGVLVEVNCETDFVSRGDIFKELVDDIAMQVAACPQVQYLATEDVPEVIVNKEKEIEMQKEDLLSKPEQIRSKIVEGRIRKRLEELALLEQPYIRNDKIVIKDWVKQTIATIGENIKVKRFIRYNLGEGLEKKSQDFAAEVAAQTAAKPVTAPATEQPAPAEAKETIQKPPTVTVSAALVKQLREETGAGMMDCKKALSETGGDLEKAQEYLRKKGLSTADKKSSRLAAEGRIGSYIHDSRIGVLIEVNCETDFVGRSEKFKEMVDDLAMQVVACPQVQFVSIEDVPESIVKKEKELEMQREDLLSKPENIREKIVEGRVSKRLGELALLEQPFIKNDSVLVKDLVMQTVAALGENIKVRRFVRFTLGESTEDKKTQTEA